MFRRVLSAHPGIITRHYCITINNPQLFRRDLQHRGQDSTLSFNNPLHLIAGQQWTTFKSPLRSYADAIVQGHTRSIAFTGILRNTILKRTII